jgi:5-methylcytosine-specific restriction endonuclease McrA
MSLNKLKELLFGRANGLCEYCKSPANISSQPFVIEHIIPKSKGGETTKTTWLYLVRVVTITNITR